jgi:hypothetical protein
VKIVIELAEDVSFQRAVDFAEHLAHRYGDGGSIAGVDGAQVWDGNVYVIVPPEGVEPAAFWDEHDAQEFSETYMRTLGGGVFPSPERTLVADSELAREMIAQRKNED